MYKQHIYPIRLGLTIAIVMFISMFLLALITKFNYGGLMFKIISDAYPGCNNKNLKGVLSCAIMGSLDGFIGGVIIALLYNLIDLKY